MGLFAHLFHGRGVPLTARRGAVSDGLESAEGDCFPHLIVAVEPASGGYLESRRYLIGELPSMCQLTARLADQPASDRPASSDFVCPFHSQASAPGGVGRSAGKRARLTRLREGASALVRGRARATRFVPDDVQ